MYLCLDTNSTLVNLTEMQVPLVMSTRSESQCP